MAPDKRLIRQESRGHGASLALRRRIWWEWLQLQHRVSGELDSEI
ncbi:predicted protein [Plenodomus lingam JN3]|uniref:Predicted protein n=1 Tax=Leptosphaeria maculans (strain JN3 / isolate v23.1.3 / race Av1-4-5-6-7-8) TaxID=985895 RepID=E5A1I2_LEPMJ|nr:predicted protein [Plenodomus lingam JN3]CBX97446.1 predicted protein [Plenodomus lingam JN3]